MAKIIYLINVLENMESILRVAPIIIMFGFPISLLVVELYNIRADKEIDWFVEVKKKLKLIVTILVIGVVGAVFIPSKETMYAMLITDKVLTKENYNMTVNEAKNLIDYTVNKIEEVKDKKE